MRRSAVHAAPSLAKWDYGTRINMPFYRQPLQQNLFPLLFNLLKSFWLRLDVVSVLDSLIPVTGLRHRPVPH